MTQSPQWFRPTSKPRPGATRPPGGATVLLAFGVSRCRCIRMGAYIGTESLPTHALPRCGTGCFGMPLRTRRQANLGSHPKLACLPLLSSKGEVTRLDDTLSEKSCVALEICARNLLDWPGAGIHLQPFGKNAGTPDQASAAALSADRLSSRLVATTWSSAKS